MPYCCWRLFYAPSSVGMCATERGRMWVLLTLPRFFFFFFLIERVRLLTQKAIYPSHFFSVQQACSLRHRLARSLVSFPLPLPSSIPFPFPLSNASATPSDRVQQQQECHNFSRSNKFQFLFFFHFFINQFKALNCSYYIEFLKLLQAILYLEYVS